MSNLLRPPSSTRSKRKVLTEEEYLSKLGQILRRDFFPHLSRLEAQFDYLTALEQSDVQALRAAANRLTKLDIPSAADDETPSMSLDEFQTKYVTEDTRDFEQLMATLNRTKRVKLEKSFGLARIGNESGRLPLLKRDEEQGKIQKGKVNYHNTRIHRGPNVNTKNLQPPSDELRKHYDDLLAEHGSLQFERELSVASSTGQYGGVGEYDFVETPAYEPTARFSIPATPDREALGQRISSAVKKESLDTSYPKILNRKDLLKSPAVQRLLRAQTPKTANRTLHFEIPSTPKRRKK